MRIQAILMIDRNTLVLRYSPYNQAVKAIIDSGALGEIVNIQVSGMVRAKMHRLMGSSTSSLSVISILPTRSCEVIGTRRRRRVSH